MRALELVAAQPTPVSQPRSVWARRALLTGALTLGVLPWTLGVVGDMLQRGSNQALRRCDPAGFGSYRTADGLYALQAVFPGWHAAALKGRTRGVTSVVNGVRVCAIDRAAPPALVNGLVVIARERLADTPGAQGFEHARRELEETLHEHGRDHENRRAAGGAPARPAPSITANGTAHRMSICLDSANSDVHSKSDETIQVQPTNAGNRLSLYALHPNELRDTEQALVELYLANMPDTQKLEMLREQKLTADLPAIFFRLGLLAVHGPRFGADASRYTAQMAALRAMVEGQPNPYLLTGLDGLSSF